jgi:hypothetical protein
MDEEAALLRTRDIIGLRPFQEFDIVVGHVAARFDALAVMGRLAPAQPLHAHGPVQSQEDDEVVERLDRLGPFRRRSREHPLPRHRKQPVQHGLPVVFRPFGRERRIGRQPEQAVGIDVRMSETPGEGRSQRRRTRAGSA